jgi:triacylglycerol lipase
MLLESGWTHPELEVVSFEDPVGSNRDHARELAEAIARVQTRTGAHRVDIVAHSMGGLATRYYLKNGGGQVVRRVVFVASPHRGTWLAHLAWGQGGIEMKPGSLFLLELDQVRGVPFGVEALTIRSSVDLHIIPPESAILEGVPDVEICCPTHGGLLSHPDAVEAMTRFLRRAGGDDSTGAGGGTEADA